MKSMYVFILTIAVVSMSAVSPAVARNRSADHGHRGHWDSWRPHGHGYGHDSHRWRSGSWRHGWHDGRLGWWWVVGGVWYLHSQPVYPYPDPYYPYPAVVIEPAPVYVQPELPPPEPPTPSIPEPVSPPPAQFWYYCEAAAGYYPYVATCPSGWKTVPAVPSGVQQ